MSIKRQVIAGIKQAVINTFSKIGVFASVWLISHASWMIFSVPVAALFGKSWVILINLQWSAIIVVACLIICTAVNHYL